MNTIKPSRTPFQNDLLNDSGQLACLHEQGVPIELTSRNQSEIHLTLDWMLSVPFSVADVGYPIEVERKTNTKLLSFAVPSLLKDSYTFTFLPWAVIAHFWATFVKRDSVFTYLPIKAYTPLKSRIDYTHYSDSFDTTARRNPTFEFDDTGCHATSIRLGAIYPNSYKTSSISSPLKVPGVDIAVGTSTPNLPQPFTIDGVVTYSFLTKPQPGVVFPRKFDFFAFVSFENAIISTITTPAAIPTIEVGEMGTRNVPFLPTEFYTQNVLK